MAVELLQICTPVSYVVAVNRRLHYWRFASAHIDENNLIAKHCEAGDEPGYCATQIANARINTFQGRQST